MVAASRRWWAFMAAVECLFIVAGSEETFAHHIKSLKKGLSETRLRSIVVHTNRSHFHFPLLLSHSSS